MNESNNIKNHVFILARREATEPRLRATQIKTLSITTRLCFLCKHVDFIGPRRKPSTLISHNVNMFNSMRSKISRPDNYGVKPGLWIQDVGFRILHHWIAPPGFIGTGMLNMHNVHQKLFLGHLPANFLSLKSPVSGQVCHNCINRPCISFPNPSNPGVSIQ